MSARTCFAAHVSDCAIAIEVASSNRSCDPPTAHRRRRRDSQRRYEANVASRVRRLLDAYASRTVG
jgi:hypothetical protein